MGSISFGQRLPFPSGQGGESTAHPALFVFKNLLLVANVYILAVVLEKVVVENDGYFYQQSGVYALAFENAVNVSPVAA